MAQRARKRPTPAIGDEVRVPADTRNEFIRYEHSPGTEGARQPIDGLVLAIREISSGEMVKVAAGEPGAYVFDLLQGQTFDPRMSSKANSEGGAAGYVRLSGAYGRVQQALRRLAGHGDPCSGAEMLARPELREALDGWRVVRVCADRVDVREPPE